MTFVPNTSRDEVMLGNVTGREMGGFTGRSTLIGSTTSDVWDEGGIMVYPTAAETWELLSTDADDTSAGTGARTVLVTSLSDTFVPQVNLVTLDGTTPVTVSGTHFRPIGITVLTSGSINGNNEGTLRCRNASGGAVRMTALPGRGRSFNSHYTVPAGKVARAVQITPFVPKNEDVQLNPRLNLRTDSDSAWIDGGVEPLYQGAFTFIENNPLGLVAGTDLKIEAASTNENITLIVFTDLYIVDA